MAGSGLRHQHEESQTTVAAIFTGIVALFIAGIAAAFLYAKDTNPTQTASAPAASSGAFTSPISNMPETTGSGATGNTPKQQSADQKQ